MTRMKPLTHIGLLLSRLIKSFIFIHIVYILLAEIGTPSAHKYCRDIVINLKVSCSNLRLNSF
jgi:hypothetical protein